MKCNPWRWLWGLIPILMLGWIAILGERERIEADLTSRTQTVFERDGYAWASVHFEGRDAVISGRATDDGEPPKAIAAALDTLGVRTVDNRVTLVDKADTYEWGALRRDNRIRVSGFVPSDQSRREVIGIVKANFPSLEVDDRMKLARGAPPNDIWMGGVGFGLKQLAMLREGRIELENTSISVKGTAHDVRGYRAVKAALSSEMPQGIRLKTEAVRPPPASPYSWSARRQAEEWLLVGHVPTDTVRDELMQAARRIAPKAKIVDRMEPASGAPDHFVEAAHAILAQLGHLDEGDARLRDKAITLKGVAETSERADQVNAALKQGVPAGFRVGGEIQQREVAVQTISPYETAATLAADKVVLSGHVPDETTRAVLVGLVRQHFGGLDVEDRFQVAPGQPDGWQRCLEVGFNALRKLGSGRISLTDRQLQVTGMTGAEALARSLPASVRDEAGAACDTSVGVTLDVAALQAQQNAQRQAQEAAARQQAEEDRRRAEATARQQAEEERRRAEATARQQAEEENRRRAEATARQQAEEDRRRAEAVARQQAEEERRRAEATARQQAEEDRRRAEAVARQQAEEDRRRAEATARQQAEEDRRRAEAVARQQAEEERRRVEAAARQQAEEESRRRAEATARQQADEERRRAEATARQQAEEEDRRRAEATARQQAEEDRRRAEATARQQAEEDRRRAEAAARQQAEEDRRRAEAAARQQADEQSRRADAAARQKAEAVRVAKLPMHEKQKVIGVCQEALSRVVREGVINFNRASYDLDSSSYPTLNKVADAANRCPALTVEIEGHTDAEGTVARNRRLSDRRANAVREYLSRAGVEPSRLEAIGFGQSRPVAPNDTPEGRAQNRRIEFVVKLKE